MKILSKVIDILLYIIVLIALLSAIGTAIIKEPIFFSAIRSNSMYPVFQRGDMIFINRISDQDTIKIGDIIIFRTPEGSMSSIGWISHRVVGGNAEQGFITKGDANKETDQSVGGCIPIKKKYIGSKVITIGNNVIKLPLLGYLPLYIEKYHNSPYLLPAVSLILVIVVIISEFKTSKKKKHRCNKLSLQLIYFFGGLTISIIFAISMLTTSQNLNVVYEVSESNSGVLMGSNIGILKVGSSIEKSLPELTNNGFFPFTVAIISKDPQISLSHDIFSLNPGQTIKPKITISAQKPDQYRSNIHIGLFLPILPEYIVYKLSTINYWLALIVVSLLPGLPLILYPIIDTKMRSKTFKEIRHLSRRIKTTFLFR